MPDDYRSMAISIVPTVLKGPNAKKLYAPIALVLDSLAEAMRYAVVGTWLRRGVAVPEDGLVALASQRNLERYPDGAGATGAGSSGESQTQLRARLERAWDTWERAGGPVILQVELAAAGWPNGQVVSPFNPFLPVEDPPDWPSQFWIFFPYGSHPVTGGPKTWGSFKYGDGTLWGLNGITVPQIRRLRAIINKWRDAQFICRNVIFELSDGGADTPPYDVALMSV